MGDTWRTCKLKCNYKYKRKENDYITRLEQDSKQLTQWLDEARRNADFWCDKCTSLKQENKKLKYLISEEQCFEEGCNKCTKAYYTDDKYRSALEEIKEKIKSLNKDICNNCGWHNTDNCQPNGYVCHDLIEIKNKINEVLK